MQRQVWVLLSAEGHTWLVGMGGGLGQEDLLPLWRSLYCLLSYFEKKKIPRKINESLVSRWPLRVWAMVFCLQWPGFSRTQSYLPYPRPSYHFHAEPSRVDPLVLNLKENHLVSTLGQVDPPSTWLCFCPFSPGLANSLSHSSLYFWAFAIPLPLSTLPYQHP